jgi:hypothetical protein
LQDKTKTGVQNFKSGKTNSKNVKNDKKMNQKIYLFLPVLIIPVYLTISRYGVGFDPSTTHPHSRKPGRCWCQPRRNTAPAGRRTVHQRRAGEATLGVSPKHS